MANPFRSLADMIGDILTYLTAPGNDVNAKLDAINKKLDQISLNLGVQPVLVVTEQEINDLRAKVNAIRQSIGSFNP